MRYEVLELKTGKNITNNRFSNGLCNRIKAKIKI